MNNYFTLDESGQFAYYQIPKQLFTEEKYSGVSAEAKLLYGILLDRMHLSIKNRWEDEQGRVYVFLTVNDVKELLHYGHEKIGRLFCELEKVGLVERKKQGQGKAPIIYPKKIISCIGKSDSKTSENQTSENQTSENQISRPLKNGFPDICFSDANNTEENNTEIINNILSDGDGGAQAQEEQIKAQIEYDVLVERVDKKSLDGIVMLIADAVSGTSPTVTVGGQKFSREAVRSRLSKLECEHIEYVLEAFSKQSTKIRSVKAYLLTLLYNAPAVMEHYYQSAVNHDVFAAATQ